MKPVITVVIADDHPIFRAGLRQILETGRAAALASAVPGLDLLTPAERKVLALLAEVKTTKEIADALGVSPRTVDYHRASLRRNSACRARMR